MAYYPRMWPFDRPVAPVTPPPVDAGWFDSSVPTFAPVDRVALVQSIGDRNFQKAAQFVTPEGIAMDSYTGNAGTLCQAGDYTPGWGVGIDPNELAWYGSHCFPGFQTLAIMGQHWFIDKACTMPGKDAVRNGWDITANGGVKVEPEVLDALRQRDKKYRIKQHCVEFVRMGRLFGIRIALPIVQYADKLAYEKPFNPDAVTPGSYKGISQIDPYWINPQLDLQSNTNPTSTDFYEPTWWQVRGKRIHRSHLIITRPGGQLPDILKPTYLYGSVSIPQKIADRVYAAERTANEAPALAMSKRCTVLHLDVAKATANQQQFAAQMQAWTQWRDNFGVKVVGLKEEIEQFDTALGDMDTLIKGQYTIACAAAGIPVTRMMSESAKGMDATGEGDEADYHEELGSIQEHDLSPLLERHYELLIRSEGRAMGVAAPFSVDVSWSELDAMTSKEQAEVNKILADTDAVLAQTGAIDGQDIRDRIIADPTSGYNGLEPDAPEPDLDADIAQAMSHDAMDAEFNERDHPRDEDGKFGSGGGKSVYVQSEKHGTSQIVMGQHAAKVAKILGIETTTKRGREAVEIPDNLLKDHTATLRAAGVNLSPGVRNYALGPSEEDMTHLGATEMRLYNETARLKASKTEKERKTRQSTVDSVQKELDGLRKELGVMGGDHDNPDMSDEELLTLLG